MSAAEDPAPDRAWWREAEFWDETFDFVFPPEHLALGERLAERAVSRLGLAPPARILDLGCGPGRVAVPLARMGFAVTGVDCQPGLLERARRRAAREGVAVALRLADVSEAAFDGEYDAALCVFNSFGYFADPRRDGLVLRRAFEALRPGGRFVLEAAHRDGVVRTMHVRQAEASDGRRWREEPRFDPVTGVLETRWTVATPGREPRTFVSRLRPYTATELRAMLGEAGFAGVAFSGDLDGSPPSLDRYMIVAVASR